MGNFKMNQIQTLEQITEKSEIKHYIKSKFTIFVQNNYNPESCGIKIDYLVNISFFFLQTDTATRVEDNYLHKDRLIYN
jgi:hypothetical protein